LPIFVEKIQKISPRKIMVATCCEEIKLVVFSWQNFAIFWQRNWENFGKLAYCTSQIFILGYIATKQEAIATTSWTILLQNQTQYRLICKVILFLEPCVELAFFFWVSSWVLSYLQNHLDSQLISKLKMESMKGKALCFKCLILFEPCILRISQITLLLCKNKSHDVFLVELKEISMI
jgi:hypothetical protein